MFSEKEKKNEPLKCELIFFSSYEVRCLPDLKKEEKKKINMLNSAYHWLFSQIHIKKVHWAPRVTRSSSRESRQHCEFDVCSALHSPGF